MTDVAIIGCGVVGAAAAYELSKLEVSVLILEKENDVSMGTSKANSAIIHAGYDPKPGTLMARLNVEGAALTKEICKNLDVPYKQIGSLVAAFGGADMETIKELYSRGQKNGVADMRLLGAEEVRELEPGIAKNIEGALYAPTAAVVNPWELTLAMAETAVRNGARLELGTEVTGIEKTAAGFVIYSGDRSFEVRYILNAAGVLADRVHDMAAAHSFSIQGSRGEYFLLDKSEATRVSHVIFQCPNKDGKGVLVAPTVHGNLIVGPNAEPVESACDTKTTAEGLLQIRQKSARVVSNINFRENIRNFSGIRAISPEREDFIIEEAADAPGFIDLAGIKSPGLSCAPAIARLAVDLLKKCGLSAKKKDCLTNSRSVVRFGGLTVEEKRALIAKNPLYGRVICRCETVTEGEIVDCLHSPIPPRSIDGVKRRTGAGMGRCQSGFCGPRVVDIIAREYGISPLDITQDGAGSYLFTGETKKGGER
ncbi:MAG: NAD(P)/FAD-dependent oxidoreductase [Oscillospiraceae bacterium]